MKFMYMVVEPLKPFGSLTHTMAVLEPLQPLSHHACSGVTPLHDCDVHGPSEVNSTLLHCWFMPLYATPL